MAANESAKDLSSCDEFVQCTCTLLSDNPAVRQGRRDLIVDHLILAST